MTPVCRQVGGEIFSSSTGAWTAGKTHIVAEEQTSGRGGNDKPPNKRGRALFAFSADDRFVDLEAGLRDVLERGLVRRLGVVDLAARGRLHRVGFAQGEARILD